MWAKVSKIGTSISLHHLKKQCNVSPKYKDVRNDN